MTQGKCAIGATRGQQHLCHKSAVTGGLKIVEDGINTFD